MGRRLAIHAGTALLTLGLSLGFPALAPASSARPADDYAHLPQHAGLRMSPTGRYVAGRAYVKGQYMLVIYDLDNIGTVKPVLLSPESMEVNWLRWKSEERLLVSLSFPNRRFGTAVVETRLIAIGPDGRKAKLLVQRNKGGVPVQIADHVVSFLPEDPDHILMAFNPDDPLHPRLYRVNVHNGRQSMVESGSPDIFSWTVDQQGNPRIGEGYDNATLTEKRYFRSANGKQWELVAEQHLDEGNLFSPVLFDRQDADMLYVLSDHEGDTTGLYRYRFSTREFVDTVFRPPGVDVASVNLSPDGTEIHGVSYVVDAVSTHWLDRRQADLVAEVSSRVAARHVYLVATSHDYRRAVVFGESADLPGRYYLYEAAGKKLQILAHAYPQLENVPMAPMRTVSYRARDGLLIPGYLSLPPGIADTAAGPRPAIILPHGGPASRDYTSFDPLVQMLTSRGYAVLQMNYRGSSGYGAAFRAAGARQWGQAMQDDVTDGTRWLIEQGIADPDRICIVGWSYGGYAALMGVVKEPALYRCSVSIAGISDLRRLIDGERKYLFGRIATRNIGKSWSDRESLDRNSPVNRVAEIRVPVLLAHGTRDRVVPPVQSDVMARALDRAKKDYRLIKLEDADHSVMREAERVQLFRAVDDFLRQYL